MEDKQTDIHTNRQTDISWIQNIYSSRTKSSLPLAIYYVQQQDGDLTLHHKLPTYIIMLIIITHYVMMFNRFLDPHIPVEK